MEKRIFTKRNIQNFLIGVIIIYGLIYSSFYNYLLFHTLIELFTIIVGFSVFFLAWNTRRFNENSYFLFIGISFFFISSMDLLHTLAYKGMNIFQGYDSNLPTQLWIAARYLQSFSFLIAPIFLHRKLKPYLTLFGFFLISFFLIASIFLAFFPDCYIEGSGLTGFKITSEYIISFIFLLSTILLFKSRDKFDSKIFSYIIASLLLMVGGEIAFTFYINVFGASNLIGHIFKLFAFFLIYLAIIEIGLKKPFSLVFMQLNQNQKKLENTIAERTTEIAKRKAAEEKILTSEERYHELFNHISSGVVVYEAVNNGSDFIIRDINAAGQRIDRVSRDEVIDRKVTEVFPGIKEIPLLDTFRRVWISGKAEYQPALQYKDKHIKGWRENYIYRLPTSEIVAVYEDITESKATEEKLRLDSQMLASINDSIVLYKLSDEKVVYTNPQFDNLFGYNPGELIGEHISILNVPAERKTDDISKIISGYLVKNGIWEGEIQNKKKDGSIFWSHASISGFAHSEYGEVWVAVQQDISDRKQAQLELTRMSMHDSLTGLYNRTFFDEEMRRLQLGRHFPVSIVLADIDGLKKINDTNGHASGDLLLKRAANVLDKSFRGEDMVARIGGDEFAALLPMTDAEAANKVLKRLASNIRKNNKKNNEILLSISYGVSTAENGKELIDALANADAIMYEVKKNQ